MYQTFRIQVKDTVPKDVPEEFHEYYLAGLYEGRMGVPPDHMAVLSSKNLVESIMAKLGLPKEEAAKQLDRWDIIYLYAKQGYRDGERQRLALKELANNENV